MSVYDDLKAGLGNLLDAGVDVYKTTLDAKAERKKAEAEQQVAQQVANDTYMVGDMTFSIKKTLLILVGVLGTVLILRAK